MKYAQNYPLEEKKDIRITLGRVGDFSLKSGKSKDIIVTLSCDREDAKKLFQSQMICHGEEVELQVKKHRNAIKASLGRSLSVEIQLPRDRVHRIFLQVTPESLSVEEGLNPVEIKES